MTAPHLRIAHIRDPALFQKLVTKLMLAEHGIDYQVVDDSGGDGGLDGFLRVSCDLYACYCPEKPDTADFSRKIRTDLRKAQTLRDIRGYPIRRFVFVTPVPLREPTQRLLRDEARSLGFDDGINIADEYLETLLSRHAALLDHFPELSYPRVAEELRAIRVDLRALRDALSPTEPSPNSAPSVRGLQDESHHFSVALFENVDTTALDEIESSLARGDPNALFRLEQFRFTAPSRALIAAASMVELDHLLERHDFGAAQRVAERGAREAQQAGLKAEEALFRSQLVRILVFQGSELDFRLAGTIGASHKIGFPLLSHQDVERESKRVQAFYARVDQELGAALSLAQSTASVPAMFWATTAMAFAEVHKAQSARLLAKIGLPGADYVAGARTRAKAAHETAIRTARLMSDESLAQAYHNYANDLRLFDEAERALYFAREARAIAERVGYTYQVTLSNRLIEMLENDLARQRTP